jgi:hypothetical protein
VQGVKRLEVNGKIQCLGCRRWKKLNDFHMNVGYRHSRCKVCRSKKNKTWRTTHPEHQREYRWLHQYGISREDYNKLLEQQDGHCYFCSYAPPSGQYLFVDHDHKTGKVRGLLCLGHNQAIGRFGDSLEGVNRLVQYLSKAETQEVVEVTV